MNQLRWKKKGRIFDPEAMKDWGYQYSQVPFALPIEKDKLRVYFTSRPPINESGQYVSYTFFADFNDKDFTDIIELKKAPVMSLGQLGAFDEFGTMPCSVINRHDQNEVWLYYVGWSRKVSVPYECAIGLATSKDQGRTFERKFPGPLLGASAYNPFVLGCPRVYNFNNLWYMYYLAGTEWLAGESKSESIYHLKVATSLNGIDWRTVNEHLVQKNDEHECQTCASVFEHNGYYHLYFTYRHGLDFRNPERGYRIGYAYSHDLINWVRNDDLAGITISSEGWDSEMICYPSIIKLNDQIIMFHCGNYFGKTGFGYAVLEQ